MLTLAISEAVRLSRLQLRFVWMPTEICVFLGIESFKLSFIVTLITDIVLLLIVLVGLLRLRSSFALERLLWNQVRCCLSPHYLMFSNLLVFPIYKGVLWLLLAIVAEVPPVVC